MAIAPDGRIFVCLQSGSLRVVKNGALLPTPFLSVTVDASGECGLLGVAFDPNFAASDER
jgi:glucose/arabinose dehydrogenase